MNGARRGGDRRGRGLWGGRRVLEGLEAKHYKKCNLTSIWSSVMYYTLLTKRGSLQRKLSPSGRIWKPNSLQLQQKLHFVALINQTVEARSVFLPLKKQNKILKRSIKWSPRGDLVETVLGGGKHYGVIQNFCENYFTFVPAAATTIRL